MKLPSLPIGGVASVLSTIRELDVRGIKRSSEAGFGLAVVSRDLPMAEHVVGLLGRGPNQTMLPEARVCAAVKIADAANVAGKLDAVILITRDDYDNGAELRLATVLAKAKVPLIVLFLRDGEHGQPPMRTQWLPALLLDAHSPIDDQSLSKQLVKAVRGLKRMDDVSLARHMPAFRESVCRSLTEDCANANAAYSFGTGLLEINPIATLPLNATDMFVLTKNQLLMCYKIALAMGHSGEFKELAPKLVAVLGSGFFFRQIARSIAGLIPGIGIIPKVAVAYAGTYAAGEAILRWSATGETLGNTALQGMFDHALKRGRSVAQDLLARRKPVVRVRKPETPKSLPKTDNL